MSVEAYDQISKLIGEHEAYRRQCMNLIASENMISPRVRECFTSDLTQRYGNYGGRDLTARRYRGNRYIQEIELALEEIVKEVFGATEVELRAISGHVAGLAVLMATCHPGDAVMELSKSAGGHCIAGKANESQLIDLRVLPLAFDPLAYNVDAEGTCKLIEEHKPALVILGASNFVFPHPARKLANYIKQVSPNTVLAYDASHVMGLIACGEFQKPLEEGVDIVFGSTHKTLPGPQGGLIFGRDADLIDRIGVGVYPSVVTNHHVAHCPALALALLEMKHNPGYALQIINNAQALGNRLAERSLHVVAADRGITNSHTVLLAVHELGTSKEISVKLEDAHIIACYTSLPEALGKEGIRLGTAEVTRLGANEHDMAKAADIIADLLFDKASTSETIKKVHKWAGCLREIHFAD